MITIRKDKRPSDERHGWQIFRPSNPESPLDRAFGTLESWKEGRLPPRAALGHLAQGAEILTYVRQGEILYEDPDGSSGILRAGEFQRMTLKRGVRYNAINASPIHWAHVVQVSLQPKHRDIERGHDERRFGLAERYGKLCVVASPDGRGGSLRVHQDAVLYSGIFGRGWQVVHELEPGRRAWLHVAYGAVAVRGVELTAGDGAGFIDEVAVSATAVEDTEILLLSIALDASNEGSFERGEAPRGTDDQSPSSELVL
jgi:redox-sensitive bicupin YhaK (pirin superfamily)